MLTVLLCFADGGTFWGSSRCLGSHSPTPRFPTHELAEKKRLPRGWQQVRGSKGRTDSFAASRSQFAPPRHMFDQLVTSTEDKARRFPSSSPTNMSSQPKKLPCTLQYDDITPTHRASGFDRTSSSPEGRRREPPALFSRLSSAPAWFPSPHEEVKVMQQSSREAWKIFGRRFHAAHTPCTRELARRSSAPDAPSRPLEALRRGSTSSAPAYAPSRTPEPARRSSVEAGSGAPQRERPSRPRSLPAAHLLPLPPIFIQAPSRKLLGATRPGRVGPLFSRRLKA
jgi:hypothetical protein